MWSEQRKLILAIVGSLLIHGLIVFFFALVLDPDADKPARATPPPKPLSLDIIAEKEKQPTPAPLASVATPTPTPGMKLIDTSDMAAVNSPPPGTQAQSAKNTAASSSSSIGGSDSRPSQEGKVLPTFMFDTHKYAAGTPETSVANTPPPRAAAIIQDTAPPLPQPDLNVSAVTPVTAKAQPATPTPAPPVPTPDEFAALRATPTPKPPDFDPFTRAPQTEPPKPTPITLAAATSSKASTDEVKTQIRGNLSNRGPTSSIATMATPQGRYSLAVSNAIRARWYVHINSSVDVASFGTVKIHFSVDRRGKVIAPHVISNSGNEALASISLQAIMDAIIPPIPEDVAAANRSADLPLDFDFSLY